MSSSPSYGDIRNCLRILLLCGGWYSVSSANGVIGKWILSEFPHPMSLTMVQLLSITLYSRPLMVLLNVRSFSVTWKYYLKLIVPLAFAKFLFSVMSHISIWKVPVSYAHTVKATMPFFTVIIARILFGEKHGWKVYFSLLPIIGGVAIATLTEASFHPLGLICALVATAGFSLINIYSKQVLKESGVHQLRLVLVIGQLSLFMFLPFWFYYDFFSILAVYYDENVNFSSIAFLLALDGFFNWLQSIFALSILKLVAPLTYAVANVTKRISIISISLLMLKNPITSTNLGGMLFAIFGVFFYNKAKYDENRAKETLPTRGSGHPSIRPLSHSLWQVYDSDVNQLKSRSHKFISNGYQPL
ncbi:solute carrier family 35 member E1 homolog [Lepeophtheirus salmonis]|uniref:solute carrier family 35 member E1 homolog n=1 Tax=Lepeophtheirus salmonis TaxID=72036 RepID=UPI001AE60B5F|nr:solute carrier family 35 member E1 homolog [Lepeophtheirus salmonis]